MEFYTNVTLRNGKILYRGIKNGRRVMEKIPYSPTLFLPSKEEKTEYKTLDNKPLSPFRFETISNCRAFLEKYKGIDNFEIFGNTRFELAYISEKYKSDVSFEQEHIQIDYIDIEVNSSEGFPEPKIASQEITAITILRKDVFHLFGTKDFKKHKDNIEYHKCLNEKELLSKFLHFWSSSYPDVITGWNSSDFDIFYLYTRIVNVLGKDEAKKLSPWGAINEKSRVVLFAGQPKTVEYVEIVGISSLDYLVVFKKFAIESSQESYTLDHISKVILKEQKVSYDEYGSLSALYEKNPQLFYEYNIHDVELVSRLEKNQNLLRLVLLLAYDAKCNYEDTFFQVRMWTQICHDWLLNKKKTVPKATHDVPEEDSVYEGAYVKSPVPGFHYDLLSIDAESLYPSIIQCFNISPETLVRVDPVSLDNLILGKQTIQDDNLTFCGNGARFRKDEQGFFVELIDHYKKRRKFAKNKMLEYEKEKEKTKSQKYNELIEIYNAQQNAYKVSINSLYGAAGSKYFLFYDERIAKAITITGQYILRRLEILLNEYLQKLCNTQVIDFITYSDTDSQFLELTEVLNKFFPNSKKSRLDLINEIYDKVLKKKIEEFCLKITKDVCAYRNDIIFKREVICDKGLWTTKKRYILNVHDKEGVRYNKPKIVIKGLEVKKSSTPAQIKDHLNKSIEIIMTKNEDELLNYIKEVRLEHKNLPPEMIASPRSVKGIVKYAHAEKSIPIHVKGALVYNKALVDLKLTRKYESIKDGNKIKFIYLKEPNPFGSHVLSFDSKIPKEFEITNYIDYNIQFEKTFIEPLKTITNPIGWKTEKKISLLKK